jgi:AraC-like DNA-binding protein
VLKFYSEKPSFVKTADKLFYCLLSEFFGGNKLDYNEDNSPLTKSLKYIEDNYLTVKKLSDLSSYAGVTVNYLCALFKSKTGVSPNRYIKRLKIRYAEELLLTTDLQIREIADKCGYLSFSHFMSDFKEILKVTPNGYKKNYCQ